MLGELLAIYETLEYEEHGWTRLLGVDTEGDGLGVELRVYAGANDTPPRRWAVHCTECLDYRLLGADQHSTDYLRLSGPPHPLLAWYTEVHEALYFSRPPADAVGAAYALGEVRRALAGGFGGVARPPDAGLPLDQFLAVGYGMLLEGPASWMREYERVLERFGAAPSRLEVGHTGAGRRDDARVLTLGGSFVIGTAFDALLLPGP